jgi:hypothetical protein
VGDHQSKDVVASELEYDSPVAHTQAQCRLTLQSLDLAAKDNGASAS